MSCAFVIAISTFVASGSSSASEITLYSSLANRHSDMVYEGEIITFTCIIRESPILAWRCDEYIGHGAQIEFLSVDSPGHTVVSQNANATLNNVTQDNGVIVLNSTLRIQASSQFSRASVSCENVGLGTRYTAYFGVSGLPPQEVNSTLHPGFYACPGDILKFVCKTRDSPILAWSSDEYIGKGGEQIEFLSVERSETIKLASDYNSVAILRNTSTENGTLVMISSLFIVVLSSLDQQGHSITCTNVGIGTKTVTRFRLAANCTNPSKDDIVISKFNISDLQDYIKPFFEDIDPAEFAYPNNAGVSTIQTCFNLLVLVTFLRICTCV